MGIGELNEFAQKVLTVEPVLYCIKEFGIYFSSSVVDPESPK